MRLSFVRTSADCTELNRVRRASPPERHAGPGRLVLGGLGLAVIVAALVASMHGGAAQPLAGQLATIGSPAPIGRQLTLGLGLGLAALALSRLTRHRAGARRQTVTVGTEGLTVGTGPRQTRLSWHAFDRFVETDHGFFLHRRSASGQWVILPARALNAATADRAALRELLARNLRPQAVDLPVLSAVARTA